MQQPVIHLSAITPPAGPLAWLRGRLTVIPTLLLILSGGVVHAATTPANTEITNIAVADYLVGNSSVRRTSSVSLTTEEISFSPAATGATLEFLHQSSATASDTITLNDSECADSSGSFTSSSSFLDMTGSSQAIPGNYSITTSDYGFKVGEPLLVRVEDQDQNLNPVRLDTVEVTITNSMGTDTELLRLTESGVDTGIFYGVLNTVALDSSIASYNCELSMMNGEQAVALYIDNNDDTDSLRDSADFDPYSRVFDAYSGALLSGVTVKIIDTSTGQEATVYDDDGVTRFPSEVVTGSGTAITASATDSTGSQPVFPEGAFRFPYLPNGTYQLEFVTPTNYRIPSQATDAQINSLSTGPYLLNGISRAGEFTVRNHIFATDIPADPLDSGIILRKVASVTSAGVGDYIRFSVTLTLADVNLTDGKLVDLLPTGLQYVSGSTQFGDEAATDPEISSNGRTLTFSVPDTDANATFTVSYVTRVTPQAHDYVVNRIQLVDDVLTTQEATARVQIEDEFFRDRSRLFGRVYVGDCKADSQKEGVEGIRLYMEDGTYVVTDEAGEWHIENVRPGSHVVQIDTVTLPPWLELQTCDNLGFHAGRSFSQFVDLQPGTLWRVDFTLKMKEPAKGEITQYLTQTLAPLATDSDGHLPFNSPVAEKLHYQLDVTGTGLAVNQVVQMVSLPEGVMYEQGSSTLDGKPIPDPRYISNTLMYDLGDKPAEWKQQILFNGIVTDKAIAGELKTKSVTRFQVEDKKGQVPAVETRARLTLPPPKELIEQPRYPKFDVFFAELSDDDKYTMDSVVERLLDLRDLKLEVVGHTDTTRIAPRSRHIFPDNQALSEARAQSVANYLSEELELTPEQISATGKGETDPIASNDTVEGKAQNRRVEVKLLGGKPDIKLESLGAQLQTESIEASIPGIARLNGGAGSAATAAGGEDFVEMKHMPEFDETWFAQQPEEPTWVWPRLDISPSISATHVAIMHTKGQRVRLLLEGKEVDLINYDTSYPSARRNLMVSTWRGIKIQPGANRFTAEIRDSRGNLVKTMESRVQYAQIPAKAELLTDQSVLVADGINPPQIKVRLTDKDGYPIRANLQGSLDISNPYQLLKIKQEQDANPLNGNTENTYYVGEDGIANIRLQPVSKAGEVVLTFTYDNGQSDELRVWLKPQPREWILVGLGEGTWGYTNSGGDAESRKAAGIDDNIYNDGRVAFYTQGQIKGEWLLTAAYDSGKPESEAFSHLIDADRYYTLYGDASEQQLDASSARKLYVRIERDRFYAMFGDINTGLNKTKLGAYNRKMTGVQSAYDGKNIEATGFVAQTNNGFMRDEIQGDGTSGLYQLSQQSIVQSSETIRIEVRDRYRSEVIISSKTLVRDADYVLDYQDGTIYFKEPIRATDSDFNPRYIVAEYEVDTGADSLGFISGGRAGVKLMDDKVKAGITSLNQNQPDQHGELNAVDAKVRIGKTEIAAEVGQSSQSTTEGKQDGSAHLVEVTHRSDKAEAKAYVRRQTENYGVDQTINSENDYAKEGVDGAVFLSDNDRLQTQTFHHQQLSTGYDTYQNETELQHDLNDEQQLSFGTLNYQAESESGDEYADQLTAGASTKVMGGRMQVSAKAYSNISRRSTSYDELKLGTDYKLTERTTLFASHETGFSREAPERTSSGVRTSPWKGAKVEQSVEQFRQEDAYQLMALSGINQDFEIDDRWTASLGFDQARNIEANQPAEDIDMTEDYYATHTGLAYTTKAWQWNSRLEYRDGSVTDKWVARSGLYHPVNDDIATGGSLDYFRSLKEGSYSKELDVVYDLALRPRQSPFAMLAQTRWSQSSTGGENVTNDQRTRKLIQNFHTNWQVSDYDQLANQYGIKRVLDQYNGGDYASTTDYMAAEWRHHFSEHWDIGAHGRRLHLYESEQVEYGTGLSIGWIPKTNAWLGVGYNFSGFIDGDFSAANFTAKGVFLKIRFKADQNSLAGMRSQFY
ncbi:OmpA family protein [Parathalassolituus penaei]|uniref:OmpA family protein n=1 Tax=Parathalassolituus penaei TaxID=2997323 RepID=A0A9X3EBL8_9GAMM|nr:OmpA family protein [Parathalassolituus penaei]MCY0963745.1 OmpA family protein [Parathalassolituus penaei]